MVLIQMININLLKKYGPNGFDMDGRHKKTKKNMILMVLI